MPLTDLADDRLVRMLDRLTAEVFAPHVGDRFRVVPTEETAFEVELVDVSAGEARGPGRQQFSLVFRGGLSPPLPQRIYRFEHDTLGAFDLFIVPIGLDESGMQYEAVFA